MGRLTNCTVRPQPELVHCMMITVVNLKGRMQGDFAHNVLAIAIDLLKADNPESGVTAPV
jgi:hypothetical protein